MTEFRDSLSHQFALMEEVSELKETLRNLRERKRVEVDALRGSIKKHAPLHHQPPLPTRKACIERRLRLSS